MPHALQGRFTLPRPNRVRRRSPPRSPRSSGFSTAGSWPIEAGTVGLDEKEEASDGLVVANLAPGGDAEQKKKKNCSKRQSTETITAKEIADRLEGSAAATTTAAMA